MKQLLKDYKRIVVKVGSSLLCTADNTLDEAVFKQVASQVASLVQEGKQVVLVSSGAIALGMQILGVGERPKKLEDLQAAAAVGQNKLMDTYRDFFSKGIFCAQILLTWEDFTDRSRYLNARNTLLALLEHRQYREQHIVPIINENDTISTDEIKFGDNDRLSALVAKLISADLLIILSDVDGLLDREKKVVPLVSEINSEIKALAGVTNKKTSVGGMITKLQAAKIAVDSGIPCVIVNGRKKDIILSVIENPQDNGTLFLSARSLSAKKHWIAYGTRPKGAIIIDDGAKSALINKKSLLAVGIVSGEGKFEAGDIVSIKDKEGREFARGIVRVSYRELEKTKGRRCDKEIVHRDNIVIF